MIRDLSKWLPTLLLIVGTCVVSQVALGVLVDDPKSDVPILLVAGLLVALGLALMIVRFVFVRKEVPR
jgi:hypothetical protein